MLVAHFALWPNLWSTSKDTGETQEDFLSMVRKKDICISLLHFSAPYHSHIHYLCSYHLSVPAYILWIVEIQSMSHSGMSMGSVLEQAASATTSLTIPFFETHSREREREKIGCGAHSGHTPLSCYVRLNDWILQFLRVRNGGRKLFQRSSSHSETFLEWGTGRICCSSQWIGRAVCRVQPICFSSPFVTPSPSDRAGSAKLKRVLHMCVPELPAADWKEASAHTHRGLLHNCWTVEVKSEASL